MLRALVRTLRNLDVGMLASTGVLAALGLAALWSLTIGADPPAPGAFWKQVIALGLGLILFLFFAALDYRALNFYSGTLAVVAIVVLILVLIAGTTIRGTTGWFRLGPVSFQPVEFVKIALVVHLAGSLARHAFDRSLRTLFGATWLALASAALVLLQPDFGSVLILMGYWFLLLVLSGMKARHIAALSVVLVIMSNVAWFFIFKDYQRERILTFLDPSRDPLGRGYNLIQSVITVGSGGLFGRGLGQGTQSQLRFLPEGQTDFIFAVVAEQFGFVAVALVIGLFTYLLYRGVRTAMRARDDYAALLAYGIVVMLALEVIVNIGMNLGLVPVTGIALPLMSAGGSSLVATFILLGILESIAVRQKIEAYRA